MKIAISITGEKPYVLDPRFGRCQSFWIYDTETEKEELLANPGLNAQGGAGIKSAQEMIDAKVDVIVTGHLGPNAFKILDKSGIELLESEPLETMQIVENYKANKCVKITTNGPAHHGM
jgi:predicted Fe-Mo cluster-binding NifX family protein